VLVIDKLFFEGNDKQQGFLDYIRNAILPFYDGGEETQQ